jgi:hypothetical protein
MLTMPMFYLFVLCAGSLGLALVGAYAFWVRLRVLKLQTALLEVQFNLYEKARTENGLNDPAYRHTREVLKTTIDMAETISVSTVMYMVGVALAKKQLYDAVPVKSENPTLQKAIEEAYDQTVKVGVRFLKRDTLSGRIAWVLMTIIPRQLARRQAAEAVSHSVEYLPDIRDSCLPAHC